MTGSDYVKKRVVELEELEKNIHDLQDLYERKQKAMYCLDKKVMEALKQNDGIVQADFLKLFDTSIKSEVSEMLYLWSKEGRIERTKVGRSYVLHLKKQP